MTGKIVGFRGAHQWLANDYPCVVEYNGKRYSSVAAAMAAEGPALPPGSMRVSQRIYICADLLKLKFDSEQLRAQLLATGDAVLVNQYEPGQASGMDQPDPGGAERLLWGVVGSHGKNVLGQLLMGVRDALKREASRSYTKETIPPFGGAK